MATFVADSMRAWNVPSLIADSSLVRDNWVPETLCKAFYDTLKCYCVCRNRQIAKLDGVFAGWAIVMEQAGEIDAHFRQEIGMDETADEQQFWCTHWATTLLGHVMDSHFSLTIESNLLSPNELDYFFWYWDSICACRLYAQGTLIDLGHRLRVLEYERQLADFTAAAASALESESKSESGKKDKKGKIKGGSGAGPTNAPLSLPPPAPAPVKPEPPLPPIGETNGPLSAAYYVLRGRKELCKGLLRVAAAVAKVGTAVHASNARKVPNPYSAWSFKFTQRFRAFSCLPRPEMLQFDDFLRTVGDEDVRGQEEGTMEPEVEAEALQQRLVQNILVAAGECFKGAKLLFDAARKVPVKQAPAPAPAPTSAPALHAFQLAGEEYAVLDAATLLKVSVSNAVQTAQLCRMVEAQLEAEAASKSKPKPASQMQVQLECASAGGKDKDKDKDKDKSKGTLTLVTDSKIHPHFPVLKLE
jgi:hypothetical protein